MCAPADVPIFITVRDRLKDLRRLVSWLEAAGQRNLVLLDNASTYEPLLDYLATSAHKVVHLGQNYGARAVWDAKLVPDEPFCVTDPDVLPIEECPHDAVQHLHELMQFHERSKVALGLYLADLPPHHRIVQWERSLVNPECEISPGVFDTLSDTTFALYGGGAAKMGLEALRTGAPYQIRHLPWYGEGSPLSAEDAYYIEHAIAGPQGSSWKQWIERDSPAPSTTAGPPATGGA